MKRFQLPIILTVLVVVILAATVMSGLNQGFCQCRNCGAKRHSHQLSKVVATEELEKIIGKGHYLPLCEKCIADPIKEISTRNIARHTRGWGYGQHEAVHSASLGDLFAGGSPFVKVIRSKEVPEITNQSENP